MTSKNLVIVVTREPLTPRILIALGEKKPQILLILALSGQIT